MARDDSAEVGRVVGSCPRRGFTGPDRRFHDRIAMAFDIAAVVLIDLRCMWGKLDVLQWVMAEVVKELATAQQVTAAMAFLDGEYCGKGIEQIHFFARPLEDSAGEE